MNNIKKEVIDIIKENLLYGIDVKCYNVADCMIKMLRCINGEKVDKDYVYIGIECIFIPKDKEKVKEYFKTLGVL